MTVPPAQRLTSIAVYALASLIGLAAFLFPLWRSLAPAGDGAVLGAGAPMLLGLLVAFCLAALVFEAGGTGLGARAVAVLGVLVATNAVLRFVEVALPGPAGFSPVFLLVILTGYAFGSRFGFLMGALTLAVSAVVTGGVGPWLPYQALAAGWVGLTAGWLPRRPGSGGMVGRGEIRLLAGFGALWGVLYGVVMTLWFWPFVDEGVLLGGDGPTAAGPVQRFLAYYVATSLGWDAFRAVGNASLILLTGAPVLTALRRFGRRFRFDAAADDTPGAELSSAAPRAISATTDGCDEPAGDEVGTTVRPMHPRAWVAWLLGTAALISLTRNPLILLTAALAVGVVRAALPGDRGRLTIPVGRFALLVIPLAALYNLLMAHSGATVLVRLPGSWPLVGGPLTLEALTYGALTGLTLVLLLATFTAFREALSARALVRLIPRAFGALTLVSAIALTYVPSVLDQLAAVREAQAVRGHRVRGVRDWIPLAVPLLVGGLERALNLAESMTARGLSPPSTTPVVAHAAVLASLVALLTGWLGPYVGLLPTTAGTVVALTGVVAMVGTLLALGRRAPFTAYHREPWRATDTLVSLAAWLPLVVAWSRPSVRATMAYSPYPHLALPPADPVLALALLGLAAPAAAAFGTRGTARRPDG